MGAGSFMPSGMIATFAQAAGLGRRGGGGGRRRKQRRTKRSSATTGKRRAKSTRSRSSRKPKPGTKAWMAYIRTKRRKK